MKKWSEQGPKQLWAAEIGMKSDKASMAVVSGKVYVIASTEDHCILYCLSAKDGSKVWELDLGRVRPLKEGVWRRRLSTPAVQGNLVFGLAPDGELVCADTAKGKKRWSSNILKIAGSEPIAGGKIEQSPLLVDDKLIVAPGLEEAAIIAYRPTDGSVLWKAKAPGAGSRKGCSPFIIKHNKRKIVVQIFSKNVCGFDLSDGTLLFNTPHRNSRPNAAVYAEGYLFLEDEGRGPGRCFKLNKAADTLTLAWTNKFLFRDPILVGDKIYASSGRYACDGCLDLKTGKRYWARTIMYGYPANSYISVDGLILCANGTGKLVLARVGPERSDVSVLGRYSTFVADLGGHATYEPALADGAIYIFHKGQLRAYDLMP